MSSKPSPKKVLKPLPQYDLSQVQLPETLLFRSDLSGELHLTETARIMVETAAEVGVCTLTEKTVAKFLRRSLMLSTARGIGPKPIVERQKKEASLLTWKQVRSFTGLCVQVPQMSEPKFLKKVQGILIDRANELLYRAQTAAGRIYHMRLTRLVQLRELPDADRSFFTQNGRYKREYRLYKITLNETQLTGDTDHDSKLAVKAFWQTFGVEIQQRELFEVTIDNAVDVNPYYQSE